MHIGIDIRPLGYLNDKAGLYQHIYNLVSSLLYIDHKNKYTLLSSVRGFRGDEKIQGRLFKRFSGKLTELFFERMALPIEFLMGKLDLFHGPCYFVPNSLHCKVLVTFHDLMAYRHPEFLKPEWVISLKQKVAVSAKRADMIIAVSDFTKGEIIDLLNFPEERIRVIHNGISPFFHPVDDIEQIKRVKAKYGIDRPYILFVSNIEPKKNIETLLHAFVKLRNTSDFDCLLVIVGKKAWYFKAIWDVVKRLHVEKDAIFTDVVDDESLPYLYGSAELFVFPSFFEGYGIPVIEAMACGTPVIASNRTSIPEIAEDAAILIDPVNADEIADAIYRVISDTSLRDHLIRKGFERAKRFSWEKTARETLALYNEII
jgi:glycosyltransferase involved in cell wall biosynthesis